MPAKNKLEHETRVELAACYRIFDMLGWSELIFNHITVKVPETENEFLINPYGLRYDEVCASNLVKVDIDGNKLEDTPYEANAAGMLIHSAIHAAREDAHCIAHIHSTEGMAVACLEDGLRHDNFYSVLLSSRVSYHDFEGITVMPNEGPRLLESLAQNNFLILKNHGLLSCGGSIAEAFLNMWVLQRACEVQWATDAAGGKAIKLAPEIAAKTEELLSIQMAGHQPGKLEFDAMRRRVEKIDPGFKD